VGIISDSELDAAVASGVISPEAAAALRAHVARTYNSPDVDEEHFRLLTGFNDIFVAIAASLILLAIAWFGWLFGGAAAAAGVAAASWGMAEFFTRRRRMALPSILLLFGFALGVWGSLLFLMSPPPRGAEWPFWPEEEGYRSLVAAGVTTIAVYFHWRRFMVPITVAAGAAALLVTIDTGLLLASPWFRAHLTLIVLLGGIAVFAVAMWWDASDPERRTRRSDVAFWLHLMAAPMLVHPAFHALGLLGHNAVSPSRALAAIAVYVGLGVVALAIDRRALLVSALAYVLAAMSSLFKAAGSAGFSFALTALIIGSMLLLLSAFWHPVRARLIRLLPQRWRARLPVA
jgi:MFS family permease